MKEKRLSPLWTFLNGQALSAIGNNVTGVAFPLLALYVSGSPTLVGAIAAVAIVPYLTLSMPVGALVDRWDRRHVMIVCDLLRMANFGILGISALVGHVTIVQLFIVAIIDGTLFLFFNVSSVSMLRRVVTGDTSKAVSYYRAIDGLGGVAGAPLGGLLFSLARGLPFLADAASYAASALSLSLIHPAPADRPQHRTVNSLWQDMSQGLRWLWGQPLIRSLAVFSAAAAVITYSNLLVLIVILRKAGLPSTFVGFAVVAICLGEVLGPLMAPWVGRALKLRWSLAGMVGIVGLVWVVVALNVSHYSPIVVGFITGAVMPLFSTVQLSSRIELIPQQLQGRVNGAYRTLVFGARPLGQLGFGLLLSSCSTAAVYLAGGTYLLLLGMVIIVVMPRVSTATPTVTTQTV